MRVKYDNERLEFDENEIVEQEKYTVEDEDE
jgi:hypothetical protein